MDPNTSLATLDAHNATSEKMLEAAHILYTWIESGGFPPDWSARPRATRIYRALIALTMVRPVEDSPHARLREATETAGVMDASGDTFTGGNL